MKELGRILQLSKKAEASGEPAVLATVVKTEGSSYRLPGARLLLLQDGQRAGSVSGGCLEDDLIRKAWWLTELGPVVRRYDTTPDGEIGSGFGLGCSGVVHVLLERLTPGCHTILDLVREVRSDRRPAAIAHIIHPASMAGGRLVIDPHSSSTNNIADAELASSLELACQIALSERSSRTICVREGIGAFIEVITPAVRLLVFGAGDDAIPLTELASHIGWQVWVFDGRAHYARAERFPQAERVILRPAGTRGVIPEIDPWTAAVLMSHSYAQDLDTLRELSGIGLTYLGVLGPRKRSVQLLSDAGLDRSGVGSALHSPMGLDIGADGPEQVAIAAIAEIQATLNGREGGPLRERRGSIHATEGTCVNSESAWFEITCVE